jgi:hypothetical protein
MRAALVDKSVDMRIYGDGRGAAAITMSSLRSGLVLDLLLLLLSLLRKTRPRDLY